MPVDPLSAISVGLGAVQTGIGIVQSIGAKKRQRNLLNQRKAFEIPQSIQDIVDATENNLQGFDAQTLNYFTNQTDQAFSGSIGAAERLGADPNALSAIFGQKVDAIMGITAKNHLAYMDNFSKYINAKETYAANEAAVQKSKQDLIKDKLQAEGLNLQSATGNISGGLNTILAGLSSQEISNLFNPDGTLKIKDTSGGLNPFTKRVTTKVF